MIKASILLGWATPSEAGAVGAFGALLLALFAGTLNFKMLEESCHTSARTVAMVFFIIVSATCFAYIYRALGGDDIVEKLIKNAGLTSWGLLFLIMAIVFALGFFLDWIEITLIVLPVFTPMIANLDFGDHVPKAEVVHWFAILMAVNLQTSFLTPPFGFALFYLKGIAPKEIKIESIYLGIIPFVILQLMASHRRHDLAQRGAVAHAWRVRELREKDHAERRISPRPTRNGEEPAALKLSNGLRRIVEFVGRWGSWFIVPLVLVTVIDVVARKLTFRAADGHACTACRSG